MSAETPEIPEFLLKVIDVIETRGWHRGDFYDLDAAFDRRFPVDQCGVCVRGAMNVAAGFEPTGPDYGVDAREDAVDALAFHLGYKAENEDEARWFVTNWNDQRAESADEVITALRECAASLKAGGTS